MEIRTTGERLEYVRRQKGKSYRELASLIGDITGDAIRKSIQKNRVKAYYIDILSKRLGANRRWIFTGKGDPFMPYSATAMPPVTPHLIDPNVWLTKAKPGSGLSDKALADIISYSEEEFSEALKKKMLSFDQVETIAKHSGMIGDFNAIYELPKICRRSNSKHDVTDAIADATSDEIRGVLGTSLKCIGEQNTVLMELAINIDELRKLYDLPANENIQQEIEKEMEALEAAKKRLNY